MRYALIEDYYNSPEYLIRLRARAETLSLCEDELERSRIIADYWTGDPVRFIEDVLLLKISAYQNKIKPFFLFQYQKDILWKLVEAERSGEDVEYLIDKLREMGMTWLLCGYMYWRWLFTPNWSAGILSRTETEVDNGTDNPDDSIFGKIRFFIKHTPPWLMPDGFTPKGKKGTSTDSSLRLTNPAMGTSITGSSTNANAFRSRRYSFIFVDECFYIEHFREVWRSIQSVARVSVFVSSVKEGKVAEQFKELCESKGHYISLSWEQHPWKDETWYREKEKLAEFDPEVIRELKVTYAVSQREQYYPEIRFSQLIPLQYNPQLPVYQFLDVGKQDLTVVGYAQFTGNYLDIIDCYYSREKKMAWYAPFMNPEISFDPNDYNEKQLERLRIVRQYKKARGYFGEAAHFVKVMPMNISIAQVLFTYQIRLIYNKKAINYEPRRQATSMLLPKMRFNKDSDGVVDLYDGIAKSKYVSTNAPVSADTAKKPKHDDEIADFRAATENLCVNMARVIKSQRQDVGENFRKNGFAVSIIKYLKD